MFRYGESGLSGICFLAFIERGCFTDEVPNSANISGRFLVNEGSGFFSNLNTFGGTLYADVSSPKPGAVLASVGLSSIIEDIECLASGSRAIKA